MALISVTEHGKIPIGETDGGSDCVSPAQADVLTALKTVYGFDIFKFVNGKTIAAQNYVGTVQLGSTVIEVLPKIDGDKDSVRRNLVGMLSVASDLAISEGDIVRVGTQKFGILEILIRLFCDRLFPLMQRGLVRRYEGQEDNLSHLRGRLDIGQQLRVNAVRLDRLYCRFEEFEEDNALNRILKAAVRCLLVLARDISNQRRLYEMLFMFDGVLDLHPTALPWGQVVFDRLNERYQRCFKMAELFLKGAPPDVTSGRVESFSLFFDMNLLFEEYIGRMVRKIFRPRGRLVTLQGPARSLAQDIETERDVFSMKPDIVSRFNGEVEWIVDTKWKSLGLEKAKEGVQQDDLYQMFAYAHCYDCRRVVLLYPHREALGGHAGVRSRFKLKSPDSERSNIRREVQVATVDLADLKTVGRQLERVLA